VMGVGGFVLLIRAEARGRAEAEAEAEASTSTGADARAPTGMQPGPAQNRETGRMTGRSEDHGTTGDPHTAALGDRGGTIDWLCLPRFDPPACLAGPLGDEGHGSGG